MLPGPPVPPNFFATTYGFGQPKLPMISAKQWSQGLTDRRSKIVKDLDLSTLNGLEIGPLDRPLVRRGDGQIVYVDHADTSALALKYAADPNISPTNLVQIDAVWGEKTLREAVGKTIDYVIASHVIEHVPDLITWLEEIRDVLSPQGLLRLAVPDRRYTFDFRRSETRLADVINAWCIKARKPLPTEILDFLLEAAEVDAAGAWRGEVSEPKRLYSLESALELAADARNGETYHDVHCWVFTPASFVRLMDRLANLKLVGFACCELFDTEPNEIEFIVHMRRCDDPAAAAASWKSLPAVRDAKPDTMALRAKVASLEGELEAMRNSRSWKLTAPLRSLIDGLRRR